MPVTNLQELFEHELQDLYSAEIQILKALPKMIKAASDERLQDALGAHLNITEEQVNRLNQISMEIDFKKERVVCEGMKGIILDSEKGLTEIKDSATKNAAIIAGAQRMEHYEMAGYGTAVEYARQLGFDDVADLLQETLDEEKQADADLNGLAKGGMFSEGINQTAIQAE